MLELSNRSWQGCSVPMICPSPRSAQAQIGEDPNLFEHCCEGLSVCSTPFYTSASAIDSLAWQGTQPKATDNSSRVWLQLWVQLGY